MSNIVKESCNHSLASFSHGRTKCGICWRNPLRVRPPPWYPVSHIKVRKPERRETHQRVRRVGEKKTDLRQNGHHRKVENNHENGHHHKVENNHET